MTRRVGRDVIAAVGILAFLSMFVPTCTYAEAVRSAEAHDCCSPPRLWAADDTCCSSLTDASFVVGVASSPTTPAIAAVGGAFHREPRARMCPMEAVSRPCSSAVILRI